MIERERGKPRATSTRSVHSWSRMQDEGQECSADTLRGVDVELVGGDDLNGGHRREDLGDIGAAA